MLLGPDLVRSTQSPLDPQKTANILTASNVEQSYALLFSPANHPEASRSSRSPSRFQWDTEVVLGLSLPGNRTPETYEARVKLGNRGTEGAGGCTDWFLDVRLARPGGSLYRTSLVAPVETQNLGHIEGHKTVSARWGPQECWNYRVASAAPKAPPDLGSYEDLVATEALLIRGIVQEVLGRAAMATLASAHQNNSSA